MIRVKLWLLTPNFHGCPINYNLWRNKLVWDFVGKNLRRFINGLLISAQILQRSAYILLRRLSFLVINSCSWYFSFKGAHSRTGDGQVFSVSHVIKHPSFSMQHLRHDVAVLKLARPATLGGKINTICLPSHGSRVSQGAQCYVTGKIFITMNLFSLLSCQSKTSPPYPIWKRLVYLVLKFRILSTSY